MKSAQSMNKYLQKCFEQKEKKKLKQANYKQCNFCVSLLLKRRKKKKNNYSSFSQKDIYDRNKNAKKSYMKDKNQGCKMVYFIKIIQ